MSLDHFLDWTVLCTSVVWGLFLVWYTLRAKWWKTLVGRNTFGVSAVLFVILVRATLLRWNDDFVDVAGIIIYVAAGLFGIQRIIAMESAQRSGKEKIK